MKKRMTQQVTPTMVRFSDDLYRVFKDAFEHGVDPPDVWACVFNAMINASRYDEWLAELRLDELEMQAKLLVRMLMGHRADILAGRTVVAVMYADEEEAPTIQ